MKTRVASSARAGQLSPMVEARSLTLNDVVKERLLFNVPIYQRLYVWGKEQIETLLDDLWHACKSGDSVYHLGSILVIPTEPLSGTAFCRYDLIDGQQRFTTLWLISVALQWQNEVNPLSEFRSVECEDGRTLHRIQFSIRPDVTEFFDAVFGGRTESLPDEPQLEDALAIIRSFRHQKDNDGNEVEIRRLLEFIRDKVHFVFSEVPPDTDLNKLFEIINNRGVQLQQHEILKARLLRLIPAEVRTAYGQLWDACSHMSDYVEKSLATSTGIKLRELYERDASKRDEESLARAQVVISHLLEKAIDVSDSEISLEAILNGSVELASGQVANFRTSEKYESERVRSIVSFSMLLQHTLRIFLATRVPARGDIERILDRDLLKIFLRHLPNKTAAAEVRCFFELLWEVRYLFDKHVIKWIGSDHDEIHAIRRLRVERGYLRRESREQDQGFALLQSMLYHSQQITTHYWLTPLLHHIWKTRGGSYHGFLKHLDNQLFCSDDTTPLASRTRKYLTEAPISGKLQVPTELSQSLGTRFPHYIFYKLEYILWEKMRGDSKQGGVTQIMGDAWKSFRITAKNSVEHVAPRTSKSYHSVQLRGDPLDAFGNLALVSTSMNSQFSNKSFAEKRALFHEQNGAKFDRKTGRWIYEDRASRRLDGLKLALVYEADSWGETEADAHRTEMIGCFEWWLATTHS